MCMTEFQKQDSETSSQSFAAKFRIIKQNSEILYVMFCESHKVIYIVYSLLGIQNKANEELATDEVNTDMNLAANYVTPIK